MSQPWDQGADEPSAAYLRFTLYRDLGPDRSLNAAYRAYRALNDLPVGGDERVSGSWQRDALEWRWRERCHAWDRYLSRLINEAVAIKFVTSLNRYAEKVLGAIGRLDGPADWQELTDSIHALGHYLTPEAVDALSHHPPADGSERAEPRPPAQPGRLPDRPDGLREPHPGREPDAGAGADP